MFIGPAPPHAEGGRVRAGCGGPQTDSLDCLEKRSSSMLRRGLVKKIEKRKRGLEWQNDQRSEEKDMGRPAKNAAPREKKQGSWPSEASEASLIGARRGGCAVGRKRETPGLGTERGLRHGQLKTNLGGSYRYQSKKQGGSYEDSAISEI